jgi:CheY-like chemotaxis protein
MVRAAQRAASRGEQLTQQLLAFARRQVLRLEVVDLNSIIGGLDTFLRQAGGETITVERALAPDLWTVRIDPSQFEAALLNLAVNARDAMPEGGTLHIEARNVELSGRESDVPAGTFVLFRLADSGVGMSKETRERAFEPFYTTKDVGKGSGLGLSQVYGFVKQAGGHIRIESAEGHGTTFSIYLPRSAAGKLAGSPRPTETPAARSEEGGHILLVEDNPDVADAVRLLVAGLGYRVTVAGTGQEALDILERGEAVDLLFTDVVMPAGMSGVDLARQALRRWPDLRILLTSGYAPDRPGGGDKFGEFPLLAKPYRRAELAKRLRAILDAAGTR